MAVVTGFVGRLAPSPPVTPRRAIAIWALRSDAQPGKHPIYHIHECPPHERTREIAARSARNLPTFLAHKDVAPYNAEAFAEARGAYAAYCERQNKEVGAVPLLLDSCCGTGRSTWNLAALRPDAFVIGVDKSLVRLTRNAAFRQHASLQETVAGADSDAVDNDADAGAGNVQDEDSSESTFALADADAVEEGRSRKQWAKRDNMILVRANCIDFWRLIWESGLSIESHTLLYPNPYPKPRQVALRWHGSPWHRFSNVIFTENVVLVLGH
jgi:tRNA G46 methylase TrmB